MKRIVILGFLMFFVTTSYVNAGCRADFEEGMEESKYGVRAGKMAQRVLHDMQEEIAAGNSDSEYLCEQLTDSRMASWLAGKSFRKAALKFRSAYMECTGDAESAAKQNRRQNEKNLESQIEFLDDTTDLLLKTCGPDGPYKSPLLPL